MAVGTVVDVDTFEAGSLITPTLSELAAWVATGESELLEFKATTGQRKEAVKALCGMLNGRGGRVVFGIDPKGNLVGQPVSDKTLEDLAAVLAGIEPEVNLTVDRIPVDEHRAAIVVTAPPGRLKPYTYRGHAYRRVGATTSEMTWDEHQSSVLERAHPMRRWETEPSRLTIDDLDISELLAQVEEGVRRRRFTDLTTRDPAQLLLRLRLLTEARELTHAAAALFGQPDRLALHYPQCVVRLARFEGVTKTDRLADSRIVNHHAFGVIAAAEAFLADHLRVSSHLPSDSFIRRDTPEIPVLALREALANAVAHREYHQHSGTVMVAIYDDRVEITNTGQLHGVSVEELYEPHEPKPWNPTIAGIIYRAGIVDSSGSGTLRMIDLCRASGLPIPAITQHAGSVWVGFARPGFLPSTLETYGLSDSDRQILLAIVSSWPAPRSAITRGTGLADRMVRRSLASLQDAGLIQAVGAGPSTRWKPAGDAARAYGMSPTAQHGGTAGR